MPDRELLVRIIGDDRDLQRALRNTERSVAAVDKRTASFGRNIGRAFAAAGVTIALSEAIRLSNSYIDAASDLEEQIARNNEVFDESAASVEAWSEGMASAFGIAQSQALEFAGTFGLLFRNLGSTAPEAERFSKQLVELAADLASFNNQDVDTALNALRSGLTGEIEPLRKFGVFLSEARTRQEAFAQTGKTVATELTNQEKVLARMSIILSDTSRAQGDFSRTSDSLANKQRIAAAEAENLAANVGKVLAPAMDIALISTIALTGGINDLVTGMGNLRTALQDTEFFDGFNAAIEEANERANGFFQNLRDNIPLMDRAASLRGRFVGGDDSAAGFGAPESAGFGGIGKDIARRAEKAAREAERASQEATRAARRRRKAFDEFIKGQGLKLDRASLTKTLQDDLAVLRAIESAVLRRISAEGKTFALMSQLTQVRIEIARTVEQQAADAEQAGLDAFNATIDALDLNLERAQSTLTLKDDQAALRAIEQRILRRIQSEGETTDLLRRLFQVRQEQKEIARQLAEQAREDRQRDQFRQLGLTEEGERPTPGSGALLRRAQNLQDQIKGTSLDTQKTRNQLSRIVRFLRNNFKTAGKEVREAILEMLNDISSAFEQGPGGSKAGPLTKTSGLNTKKVLEGLGLTAEQINELRGRLSSINTAGQQLAAIQSTVPGGFGAGTGATAGAIQLESTVNVNLDGQQIAKVVTKQQQKNKRRNPMQKRGPNRNR